MSSIAFQYGFSPEVVWNHPHNEALRERRKDPYVLSEGDLVFIPDLRLRMVAAETSRRHIFRRRGVPEKLRTQLLLLDTPRANVPYQLTVDGATLTGTTDEDGWVDQWISPTARHGILMVDGTERYELLLGQVDPIDTPKGVQDRLVNLGYLAHDAKDEPAYKEAIEAFQRATELAPTGEIDTATREELVKAHGC